MKVICRFTYAQSQAIALLVVLGIRHLSAVFEVKRASWRQITTHSTDNVVAPVVLAVHGLADHLFRIC